MKYQIKQRWSQEQSGLCLYTAYLEIRGCRRPHTRVYIHCTYYAAHTHTQYIKSLSNYIPSLIPLLSHCSLVLVLGWVCLTWRCPLSEPRPEPGHTGKAESAPRAASCLGRARSASPSPPPENCRTGRGWWWHACCGRFPPVWAYEDPGGVRGQRGRFTTWVRQGLWYQSFAASAAALGLCLCFCLWLCQWTCNYDSLWQFLRWLRRELTFSAIRPIFMMWLWNLFLIT